MIQFACDHCGKTFRVADSFAGKSGACSQCGGRMSIPSASVDSLPAVSPPRRPVARPIEPPPLVPVVEIAQVQPIPVPAAQPYVQQPIMLQPVVNVTVQNTNTATSHAQATATAIAGGGVMGVSKLGRISLIMGVVCFLGAWVPYLGILLMPVALIGIVLGLAGFLISLVGRRSSTGTSTLGMLLNFAALPVAAFTMQSMVEKQKLGAAPPAVVLPGGDLARMKAGAPGELAAGGGAVGGVWLWQGDAGGYAELDAAIARYNSNGPAPGEDIKLLAEAGKTQLVGVGSKVKVLDVQPRIARVEIVGGEDAGKAGWVAHESVRLAR